MEVLGPEEELTAEQKYSIVQNIMNECSQGKGYIYPNGIALNYRYLKLLDFQKVLFATSLDTRCKIDLTTYHSEEYV